MVGFLWWRQKNDINVSHSDWNTTLEAAFWRKGATVARTKPCSGILLRHLCTLSQCVIHGDSRAALTHVLVPREGHAKVTRLTRPQKLQSAFAEERAGWDLNDWTRESVSPGTWEIHKLKAGLSFLQRNWTERMKSEGRNRETRGGSGQSLSALSVGSTSRFHTSVQKHHLDVQHMQKSCTLRQYKAVWTLTWRLECKNELRSQLTQEMLFTFFYGRHQHD